MELQIFTIDHTEKPIVVSAQSYQSEQGHLRADALVTRAGVLRYWHPVLAKWVNVLRHPDEVFNADSLASLAGLPITLDHPRNEQGYPILVTPENWSKYGKGTVGDSIDVINPYVKISGLNIQDKTVLDTLAHNKQLSPGYHSKMVPESGVFDGINYDFRQYGVTKDNDSREFIRYNHVCVCPIGVPGRSGENVRVLVGDSLYMPQAVNYDFEGDKNKFFDLGGKTDFTNDTKTDNSKGKNMTTKSIEWLNPKTGIKTDFVIDNDGKIVVDAVDFQQLSNMLQLHIEELTKMKEMLGTVGASDPSQVPTMIDTLKAEISALKADSEASKTQFETEFNNRLNARRKLETSVAGIIGDCLDKDETTIKKEVITKWNPTFVYDSANPAILDTVFNVAIASLATDTNKGKETEKEIAKTLLVDNDKPKKKNVIPLHLNLGIKQKG